MSTITHILEAAEAGDEQAAARLLPLVYDELRRLAVNQLANERPGQTLQATALVHEAYLRLAGDTDAPPWRGRVHFFAAAAEAMRRILIENARRKARIKRGGGRARVELTDVPGGDAFDTDLLALDEVLDQFASCEPETARLVKLHVFAGLTIEQAASMLGLSARTAYRNWAFARAWLYRRLGEENSQA